MIDNKNYLTEVSENNVIFENDLVTTYAIGNITLTNGSATIPAKGKSLKEVWNAIYMKKQQPSVTQPSYTFTASGGSKEVGETFTLPTATFKVTGVGSYTYGPATGIKFSGSITGGTKTTSFSNLDKNATATVKYTSDAYPNGVGTYEDGNIVVSFLGTYSYNEGATPVDNLGNPAEVDPIMAVSNAEMTTNGATLTCTFAGYRKMFVGLLTEEKSSFTSADIRALSTLKDSGSQNGVKASRNEQSFTVGSGTKQIVVAYPKSLTSSTAVVPTFKYEALGQWFTEENIVS